MGTSQSQSQDADENVDLIEVYLLFKELSANKYTTNQIVSHHTCLFKCKDGSFYHTELDVITKGGPCQLHFGQYNFLTMPIYYKPLGLTRKTLKNIIAWVTKHKSAGTSYTLIFNDCQVYARSCMEFLELFKIPPNLLDSLGLSQHPMLNTILGRTTMPFSMITSGVGQRVVLDTILDKTLNIRQASSPSELSLSWN
ncbi:hypothetical protein I4U23_000111 [Adineta vaga]|nr:hypothetical protein I4U23_000111 [Adineta vaga]